jgi:hypothetical protein
LLELFLEVELIVTPDHAFMILLGVVGRELPSETDGPTETKEGN